jgi:RNAse (barnase) inhibitor barstar
MSRAQDIDTAVAQVLQRPDLNGVYRLSLSGVGGDSRLDGRCMVDKRALLTSVSQGLDFPDYFGKNWDALEECLGDMHWREGPIWLVIEHANAIPQVLLDTLLEIFADQAAAWTDAERACSLFLCDLENPEIPLLA